MLMKIGIKIEYPYFKIFWIVIVRLKNFDLIFDQAIDALDCPNGLM